MVAKNKAIAGRGQIKKLKLKRETLKDLDAKGKAKNIKGGQTNLSRLAAECGDSNRMSCGC